MKLSPSQTAKSIAQLINAEIVGDENTIINGINEIHKVVDGDSSFVDHPKYYDKCLQSKASVVLINAKVEPQGKTLIVSEDPIKDYNKLIRYFQADVFGLKGKNQNIATNAKIFPGVQLGENVSIGENSILYPNVVVYNNTSIGENVIVHSNTTIGSDAFYFNRRVEGYLKLQSGGSVIIEDNVEIGSGCTIDKGVSGNTIIGYGTKIDNQVHIAHGVEIGKHCLIAAQVGIAGKTIVEDDVKLWGQVGLNKSITIGEGAEVYARSGIAASIEGGKKYFGSPAIEARDQMRILGIIKKLPEIWEKVKKLS